ncbi:uncharacterized protein LOC113217285 [Frankliniella occidentalis]|uniref:Uncharacterized protein LOC113217285 n=1 Tax=Frankliniella occidentalis TaxID=133901 RepID=A0A6J1THC6_FRAOC|nr:uncharacterized protein LOC113217285 [Frankliniella occidentalis]
MNHPTSKRRSSKPPTAALSEKEAQEAMVVDWAANKRSVTVMAPYLVATRSRRNKEAQKCKSLDMFINYPALTIPQLLLSEFSEMDDVKIAVSVMRRNWLEKLPLITKYIREHSIYNIGDNFSVEQQTVMVLENIHRLHLFQKRTKPNNNELEVRACRVLEIFPENTPLAEAKPSLRDPLRISGIGAALGKCSFFAYCDTEPIFNSEDPIEALLLLLATYWVFHLTFRTPNKMPILFLSACILGPIKIKSYVSRNEKFLDFCRDQFHMTV